MSQPDGKVFDDEFPWPLSVAGVGSPIGQAVTWTRRRTTALRGGADMRLGALRGYFGGTSEALWGYFEGTLERVG